MTPARAAVLSSLWLAAGLLAAGPVLLIGGSSSAVQYLAAYLVERSLSLDNVLAFLLVLDALAIPPASRPRVVRRGIAVALLARAAAIACGAALIGRLEPITYAVGALPVVFGWRALHRRPRVDEFEHSRPVTLVRRLSGVTTDLSTDRFVVHEGRRWSLTPLGLGLIALALADVSLAARLHSGGARDHH